MSRDEILHLMILEADGGLEPEDGVRLRQALQKDSGLEDLRRQVTGTWSRLRTCAAAARMPAGFGEDQLDHWTRSTTDGLLVGAAVRLAAAFLLMATLVRALAGPITVARVQDRPHPERRLEEPAAPTACAPVTAGAVLEALPGWVRHLELAGGEVDLADGSLAVETPWRLRLLPGPLSVAIATGSTPVELHCSGAVIVARDARFLLEQEDAASAGVLLRVQHGAVRVSRGGQDSVASAAAPAVLLPSTFVPEIPREAPWTAPEAPEPPEPSRSGDEEPLTAPDTDGDGTPDPMHAEFSGVPSGTLVGQITTAGGAIGVDQALVRLTAVPWRVDNDLPEEEFSLTGAALMDALSREAADAVYFTFTNDARGSFVLDDVPAGLYRLDVLVPRNAPLADAPRQWLRLEAGKESRVSIDLGSGATATGLVVDESGRALSATVSSPTRAVETDPGGAFHLHGVAAGEELWVDAPGYVPQRVIAAAWTQVVLQRGGELRVHVATAGSAPASGATVTVQWRDGRQFRSTDLPRQGPDRFAITGVPGHVALRVAARAEGQATAAVHLDAQQRPAGALELELLPDATGSGLRRQQDSASVSTPVPGRSVHLCGTLGTAELWALWVERDAQGEWLSAASLGPAGERAFELPDTPSANGLLVIGTLASPRVLTVPGRDLPADGEIAVGEDGFGPRAPCLRAGNP